MILTCSVSSSEFCFWRTHLGAALCHPRAVPPDGMAVDDSTAVRLLCHQRKDKRRADGQCRLPTEYHAVCQLSTVLRAALAPNFFFTVQRTQHAHILEHAILLAFAQKFLQYNGPQHHRRMKEQHLD